MDFNVWSSFQDKAHTVIEYWRNLDDVNTNLSDNEILQSFFCFALDQEFIRIMNLEADDGFPPYGFRGDDSAYIKE